MNIILLYFQNILGGKMRFMETDYGFVSQDGVPATGGVRICAPWPVRRQQDSDSALNAEREQQSPTSHQPKDELSPSQQKR
ncbi:hypothetical protein KJ766_00370 [Patescibacteria group bacterium]|nr:hypothetical protein [Patescibacteria group bacterium]